MPRSRPPQVDRSVGPGMEEGLFLNEAGSQMAESADEVHQPAGAKQVELGARSSDAVPAVVEVMRTGTVEVVGEAGGPGVEAEMYEGRAGIPTTEEALSGAVVALVPGADEVKHLTEMAGVRRLIRKGAAEALERQVLFPERVIKGEVTEQKVVPGGVVHIHKQDDGTEIQHGATVTTEAGVGDKLKAWSLLAEVSGAKRPEPQVSGSSTETESPDGTKTRVQKIRVGDREVEF